MQRPHVARPEAITRSRCSLVSTGKKTLPLEAEGKKRAASPQYAFGFKLERFLQLMPTASKRPGASAVQRATLLK
jgi:hypothetical protein